LISQKLRMLAALFSMEVLFFSIIALAVIAGSPQLFLFTMVLAVCRAVFRLTIAVSSLSGFGVSGRVSFLDCLSCFVGMGVVWYACLCRHLVGAMSRFETKNLKHASLSPIIKEICRCMRHTILRNTEIVVVAMLASSAGVVLAALISIIACMNVMDCWFEVCVVRLSDN